jgi:hypothetical protein
LVAKRPGSADPTMEHARAAPIGRTEHRSGITAALHCPGGAGAGLKLTDKNDTRGLHMFELNYLPIQNVRIALQYAMFTKLQSMSSGYALGPDGVTLRNPKDNKLLYLYTWFAF